ncbi:hypothetical protein [Gracilimonas sp.]|uniref:hypothetical protein n=1 Tax=Gracilimonas sp. TaxID=1974203 RepID=UPI003D14196B
MKKPYAFFLLACLILTTLGCEIIGGKDYGGDDGISIDLPPPPYQEFPRWSPDGNTIIYYQSGLQLYDPSNDRSIHNPDSAGIWAMDFNGENQRKILNAGYADWSPNGDWIVYVAGAQIFKVRFNGTSIDTSTVEQLTFEGRNFFPDWSPDGEWIAYDSNYESPTGLSFLWKMKNDGPEKQKIVFTPDQGEARMPSWSSNSKKIVHIQYLVGVHSSEIFSVNSDGSNPIQLIENKATDYYPKYSPDGETIAFATNVQIWSMSEDGKGMTQLTFDERGTMPDWSPDGEQIIYSGPKGAIWVMDKDGSNQIPLTFRPEGKID